MEGDDDRVGIPEDAADMGLGNEAGKPIQILEELEFGHRQSMTRIPQEGKSSLLRKSRGFYGFEVKNHPLESPKSPVYKLTSTTMVLWIVNTAACINLPLAATPG